MEQRYVSEEVIERDTRIVRREREATVEMLNADLEEGRAG